MTEMAKKPPWDSSLEAIALTAAPPDNPADDMNGKEEASKPSIHGATRDGKRERAFELSLPAVVTGVNKADNRIREKTTLVSISSEQATVRLRSRVEPGLKLKISLEIPKTLILQNQLRLHLTGTVAPDQADVFRPGRKQEVLLRLDRKFRLLPVAPALN
ncbi:MAG: hypothetical protein A2W03_01635 [Candidatus Aminicenantes bacterium RBG_16_63_16]|nr:MAG: hypothetical protein A2W03_01635 [Candidatus Aminicenantes bacterium RBG_16_63_16]